MAYNNDVTRNVNGFFNNASPTVTSGGPSVDQPFAAIGARMQAPYVYDIYTFQNGATGTAPTALVGAGTTGATGTIAGNDVAGTVTLTTTAGAASAADYVTVTFGSNNSYSPQSVLISPAGATAAAAGLYTSSVTSAGFTVAATSAKASSSIKFSYLVID